MTSIIYLNARNHLGLGL